MKSGNSCRRKANASLRVHAVAMAAFFILPFSAMAQNVAVLKQEKALCTVERTIGPRASNMKKRGIPVRLNPVRTYRVTTNQLGYFQQVSGIPNERVLVTVAYPAGKKGDKVDVLVADGGKLDKGTRAQVMSLNSQKNLIFYFQVARDPGLYRILLRRGNDTKIVRLWVGEEVLPVKQ